MQRVKPIGRTDRLPIKNRRELSAFFYCGLPLLFFCHLISGSIIRQFDLSWGAFSITGLADFLAIFAFLLMIGHPAFRKKIVGGSHKYSFYMGLFALLAAPSLFVNADLRSYIAFATHIGSLIAVFYLSQLYWSSLRNLNKKIPLALQAYFLFIVFMGLVHAYDIQFSFRRAFQDNHDFAFAFFEFPHSAAIFTAALLPLYYKAILDRILCRANLAIVYGGLPMALAFSGAKIGLVVYAISLILTIMLSHLRSVWGFLMSSTIVAILCFMFIGSPLYERFAHIVELPMSTYLDAGSGYSVNSMQTRTRVWLRMITMVLSTKRTYTGFGWRAWDLYYRKKSGAVSSQSDYVTIFFDLGLIGLGAFLVLRGLILCAFYRYSKSNVAEPLYILVGVLGSLYVGGLTESVEGYSSTCWLIPVLLGLSRFYSERALLPNKCGAFAHNRRQE